MISKKVREELNIEKEKLKILFHERDVAAASKEVMISLFRLRKLDKAGTSELAPAIKIVEEKFPEKDHVVLAGFLSLIESKQKAFIEAEKEYKLLYIKSFLETAMSFRELLKKHNIDEDQGEFLVNSWYNGNINIGVVADMACLVSITQTSFKEKINCDNFKILFTSRVDVHAKNIQELKKHVGNNILDFKVLTKSIHHDFLYVVIFDLSTKTKITLNLKKATNQK